MLTHYTHLDEHLAVGSHPASPEQIAWLADAGIKGVVNLQSDEDLRSLGLPWELLWQCYTRAGITPIRVPIIDFDRADLSRNLPRAEQVLTGLVRAGRKTYVHCNAGMNRSPTTVIAHLVAHRGLSVASATDWLVSRHDSVPYRDVLERWALVAGHRVQ